MMTQLFRIVGGPQTTATILKPHKGECENHAAVNQHDDM